MWDGTKRKAYAFHNLSLGGLSIEGDFDFLEAVGTGESGAELLDNFKAASQSADQMNIFTWPLRATT
jgi:hypothetical protein